MIHATRQALKPIFASLAAAFLAVAASALLKAYAFPMPVKILIALLPAPAYAVLILVILRGVRVMDEMQRRIHLEAAAICLTATVMITITYGFLGLAGAPQPNWAFVACVMALLYTFGYAVAHRHYR
jgi:hypothetical protein